jgi:phasin
MQNNKGFEIPDAVREMAEKNVEQTRSAYNQFMDMARQAQEMAAKSQGQMVEQALSVQSRALKYAEDNVEASFRFASELAKAKDLQQYMDIQTKHAQKQMQAFQEQAGELGRLMGDAMKK